MSQQTSLEALWERKAYRRGFWALLATQFQGAFNDNAFKQTIILSLPVLLTAQHYPESWQGYVTGVSTLLFNLPFILLPGIAGALADRYSKQSVALATKYFEVAIMVFGAVAFYIGNPYAIWAMLFLMGLQSTLFSPAKYGILPETLPEGRLSWGNGVLATLTFVAIILGTGAVGPLLDLAGGNVYLIALPLIVLSILGTLSARWITHPPAAAPDRPLPLNPWADMGQYVRLFLADRWLLLTMLGITYFWFCGQLMMMNIIEFAKGISSNNTGISIMLASLTLGIGGGSMAAGYLSRGRIEVGLIPLGALGLSFFSAVLGLNTVGLWGGSALLFALGFFGGIYDLPMQATLQQRSPDSVKGGMIAANNFFNFVGMGLAAGLFILLFGVLHVSPRVIFLLSAVLTLAVGIYICYLLPMFLLRFILWVLGNTFYRLTVAGAHHVPQKSGALIVANHTSFIDALAVIASLDRPMRFLMDHEIYDLPWVRPLAKAMNAIPISPKDSPRELITALKTAASAIENGELVCIFAEGQISRTGQLLPFRKGFERIMKGLDAPIIPVYLDQLWGSVFSYSGNKFFWKVPRSIPYRVTVAYGAPMPGDSTPQAVRQAMQELGTEAFLLRKHRQPMLHRAFVRSVRRRPFALCMADMTIPKLSYFKTYVGALVFARKLNALLDDHSMVGVLLPSTVGGALTNIALQFMGRTAVNLNYTAAPDAVASAARQCNIRHVITAHAFLEKVPMDVPGEAIYLEDIRKTVTGLDRITAMLMAVFLPVRVIERRLGGPRKRSVDDLATIIFSSGSEGEPKGVMLSHFNISCNIEATLQVFPHEAGFGMTGILPFFHSFGYLGGLWLPLFGGFFTVYYPNPLDAKTVGSLIGQYHPQFLIATPTFLQNFIRRCLPEEMSSLIYVVTGAEKLSPRIREAFRAKFGIEPLEGYGTTECAPVVSVNVPDFRAPGFYQVGTKHGTIGHPVPGVSVRVIDPDTEEPLQDGTPGLLLVKGPNIMQGYLGQPEKTAKVLRNGWYSTGDIAAIDEDGFITITDRLSRFSKIAGEMVPHNKIEETFHEMLGLQEQSLAIVGVPDESRGERLVCLHTLSEDLLDSLLARLDTCSLPKLWIPKPSAFYRIETIPVLGTGKVDLRALKKMANELDLGV